MNILISKILEKCADRQVLVTTHSSYVLNKLGLEQLILVTRTGGVRVSGLTSDTKDYFQKLPGYDTLRLVLAKRAVLVEGPSDELIVQRAYKDRHGHLPIGDGVDVISVGLSFKRFLELAVPLSRRTAVVTDNDGHDPDEIRATRCGRALEQSFISAHVGPTDNGKTLEPQLVAVNDLATLNGIFNRSFATKGELAEWMESNKTASALAIFDTETTITMPEYIRDAVA